jgi:hypothetical protein
MTGWSVTNDLEERGRNLITYYHRICMEGLKKTMKSFSVWMSPLKHEQGAECNLEGLSTIKNTIKLHVRVKLSSELSVVIF